MSAAPLALYNPARGRDDEFVANFIARRDVLKLLLNELRSQGPAGESRHQILVGARGMGKTTLLRRIAIAIGAQTALKTHFIPLRFREEQYNVISLDAFWRNCGEALAQYCEDNGKPGMAQEIDLAIKTPGWRNAGTAAAAFLALCENAGGRAILLIDNIDIILLDCRE